MDKTSDVELYCSFSIIEGADYLGIIFASIFFVSLGIVADIKAVSPDILLFLRSDSCCNYHQGYRLQSSRLHDGEVPEEGFDCRLQ